MVNKCTTLWDIMKAFNSQRFVQVSEVLGMIRQGCNSDFPIHVLTRDDRQTYLDLFKYFEIDCLNSNLVWSARTVRKIIEALPSPKFGTEDLDKLGHELMDRLSEEMESMLFFLIEPSKQYLFTEKYLFRVEVATAFPSAIVDIEEAGKCMAFERWTASVFHLMRVMEVGLRVLENTLKLPPSTTNRSWERVLKECDKQQAKPFSERTPEWQNNGKFLAEATAMLRSVKVAWRNPTMHIERTYTEEQVEDIWNVVKGFMQYLAMKIKE